MAHKYLTVCDICGAETWGARDWVTVTIWRGDRFTDSDNNFWEVDLCPDCLAEVDTFMQWVKEHAHQGD